MSYSRSDTSVVECEWGSWSGKQAPLTITGLKEGSATITITLKDSDSGTVLDTETIKVTVTSPSSGNDGGSDGGNSSGGTNWFTFILNLILFPIRIVLRLLGLY